MNEFSLIKVAPPYEKKKIRLRLEIEDKNFPPCMAKEVEQWSHLQMRTLKYIVHVDYEGKIEVKRVA